MDKADQKPTELDIAKDFPPSSWEEWLQAVEATLKGVPFDKAMITKTYEGIDLKPIYRRADTQNLPHLNSLPGQAPFVRGFKAEGYTLKGWIIAQEINESDPQRANQILLDELNRGLNALNIKLAGSTRNGKNPATSDSAADGVVLSSLDDISSLLQGVDLTAIPILLKNGKSALPLLALLNAYLKKQDIPVAKIEGCVGFDPIAELAMNGRSDQAMAAALDDLYQMTYWADAKAPRLRTILLDAAVYGNSGCNAVQELACGLATAVDYISGLTEQGLSGEQAASHMQLNLSLGSNFFMEMAKVRAARLLWTELLSAYGLSAENCQLWIHGVTSAFNKTIYDPYVNVLRTTTESFAGVAGGLDSLEITPFDALIHAPEEFSRRIARNQQIILEEEAHFAKVTDPVGGCYYVETLTAQLAAKAWTLLQEIEARGGMLKAVLDGFVQSEVRKVAEERITNADKRRDVFVGINMFANPLEQLLETQDDACASQLKQRADQIASMISSKRSGLLNNLNVLRENTGKNFRVDMITNAWLHQATLEEICSVLHPDSEGLSTAPLPRLRATQHIEDLRAQVIAYQKKNDKVLAVFLANLGPLAQHKARADFALGFLQVGGFYVAGNDGFATVGEAAEAALVSQAQAVCLCSTDDTYPDHVPRLIEQIKAKKPDMIFILAGFPQDMAETYKKQGIDIFIHIRANTFDCLTDLAQRMGVNA
jgi:methylmalonyl-CoA mutase